MRGEGTDPIDGETTVRLAELRRLELGPNDLLVFRFVDAKITSTQQARATIGAWLPPGTHFVVHDRSIDVSVIARVEATDAAI